MLGICLYRRDEWPMILTFHAHHVSFIVHFDLGTHHTTHNYYCILCILRLTEQLYIVINSYILRSLIFHPTQMGSLHLSLKLVVCDAHIIVLICITFYMQYFCMIVSMVFYLQCIKYRTDQLQDVKKLERLNNTLLRHMIAKIPT